MLNGLNRGFHYYIIPLNWGKDLLTLIGMYPDKLL